MSGRDANQLAPPTFPTDVPALPDGRCNGCAWGWEKYQNPHGIWLHRNANDTLGCVCWLEQDEDDDA